MSAPIRIRLEIDLTLMEDTRADEWHSSLGAALLAIGAYATDTPVVRTTFPDSAVSIVARPANKTSEADACGSGHRRVGRSDTAHRDARVRLPEGPDDSVPLAGGGSAEPALTSERPTVGGPPLPPGDGPRPDHSAPQGGSEDCGDSLCRCGCPRVAHRAAGHGECSACPETGPRMCRLFRPMGAAANANAGGRR